MYLQTCTTVNHISFTEHLDTREKVITWGTTLEILATASPFRVGIFEATDSLTPGKMKWLKSSPVDYENLRGLEDASDFNTCRKSWLQIVYIGSCHFGSIKPLDKDITLTRPQLEVKHYHMELIESQKLWDISIDLLSTSVLSMLMFTLSYGEEFTSGSIPYRPQLLGAGVGQRSTCDQQNIVFSKMMMLYTGWKGEHGKELGSRWESNPGCWLEPPVL